MRWNISLSTTGKQNKWAKFGEKKNCQHRVMQTSKYPQSSHLNIDLIYAYTLVICIFIFVVFYFFGFILSFYFSWHLIYFHYSVYISWSMKISKEIENSRRFFFKSFFLCFAYFRGSNKSNAKPRKEYVK